MSDGTTTNWRLDRRAVLGGAVGAAGAGLATHIGVSARAAAQDSTPTAFLPLLEEWAAAWSSGDPDRVAALFTDDAIFEEAIEGGMVTHGTEDLRAYLADFVFAAFPDLRVELTSGFVSDGWAAAEWRQTATHTGDLPDVPATGRSVSWRAASILELEGDKIRRESEYFDLYSILLQLGLIPGPETEAPPTAATPEA